MAFKNKTTIWFHLFLIFTFSLIYSVVLSLSISYVHLFLGEWMTQHTEVFAPKSEWKERSDSKFKVTFDQDVVTLFVSENCPGGPVLCIVGWLEACVAFTH